jgi:hypothetical protein
MREVDGRICLNKTRLMPVTGQSGESRRNGQPIPDTLPDAAPLHTMSTHALPHEVQGDNGRQE